MLGKLITKFGKIQLLLRLLGISFLLGFLMMFVYSKLPVKRNLAEFYSIAGFIFCSIAFIGLFLPINVTILLYKKYP